MLINYAVPYVASATGELHPLWKPTKSFFTTSVSTMFTGFQQYKSVSITAKTGLRNERSYSRSYPTPQELSNNTKKGKSYDR